ncbi:MAG TPA: hypothetical protein VK550_17090 [Polyangiaceae bacterium]|nr:hypothetical protein [Polyangiaceae bacterium]
MPTRSRFLIHWMLLLSAQLIGTGCEGSDNVRFANPGTDAGTGTGGTATSGGTASSGGAAGSGGAGTAGTGGASGGTGGAAGISGASGSGAGGASGDGGAAGIAGASGSGGAGGASGTSGTGGNSGASGTSGTGGNSGASGASATGGASGTGGAAGTSGGSGSAGSGIDAGPDGDASRVDVRADGDAAPGAGDASCPTIFGTYQINNADGNGCGDLDENAPQEIRGTAQACFLHFISVVDGGVGAINGGATLGPNGTFSGATLVLGSAMRNPCSGSWNANQQEMTVVCGSGVDQCSVELLRTGP